MSNDRATGGRNRSASNRKSESSAAPKRDRSSRSDRDAFDLHALLAALRSLKSGDFEVRLPQGYTGLDGELAEAFNEVAVLLDDSTADLERISHAVGQEGQTRQRLSRSTGRGGWTRQVDATNKLIDNLVEPTGEVARVIGAVAKGDLSQRMAEQIDGHPLRGAFLQISTTVNTMVEQLSSFAAEVTRVAREVGTEGKLGGQAEVKGVAGTWKDLTDNVNSMANNLTNQVRNIAAVTTAVARGDLSKKITVEVRGEILELKDTINTMVDQLGAFASEVTRVAREVGTEGKLGGQAAVEGVAGTWKDLTENVNSMANNLTGQVRNIAAVTTAVARGDLSKKITVEVRGEILELKNTINTMVDQLGAFASEVTRVAREVGTEGKLGGQAEVVGVAGTWKDLTDNVNSMANNLTEQVRNIAEVTTAVAGGDLSKKITVSAKGEILELKDTINTMVDQLGSFAAEVTRVAREVGTEGRLGGKAVVRGVAGTWMDLTDNVNLMADNLTAQVRNIAEVTTAVAKGDLSRKITVDVKGEILELKNTINTMVDQLSSFASEVTRVAREVGTEGKLGGQAEVRGVDGIWEDLTDSVNMMAANLTSQVRGIVRVVTSVARGDLTKNLIFEAKGEVADLAETINGMIATLATFADQVTSVAREVGVEGKLGGQANVPGASGTWKDLTDNVNQLAANLTAQVRAIAEVATAVTEGDLSRSIKVEASGEVAALKDNINEMIRNLRETTRVNKEQDWLKTNVARFTRLLQGQKDLQAVARLVLSELAPVVASQHGAFYQLVHEENETSLRLLGSYGFKERKNLSNRLEPGEGLIGQAVLEKQRILVANCPDDFIRIRTGLGEAAPRNTVVLPVLFEDEIKAVIELATFNEYTDNHLTLLDQLAESIGIVLNTIAATMRTEELLKQSQSLAEELQSQQEELRESNDRLEAQALTLRESEELLKQQREQLQQTNEELEEKADLLATQKREVEHKNEEIELARNSIQEKAEQLALTSRYKSQFLANMSHELRTPLNSLLILTQMLADNPDENLTEKQVEFAESIHSSGVELLSLINDILDMSKIESGTVSVEVLEVPFADIEQFVDRSFRQVAERAGIELVIERKSDLPQSLSTDEKRLRQVLKNLLSNAIKFTHAGRVTLRMEPASSGWSREHLHLNAATNVVAFVVNDTGIGIPAEMRQKVFEPFQQVDMTSTRQYGGTGLGLSISREIATLLGGEIRLESELGVGSTFTLYLPQEFPATEASSASDAPAEIPRVPATSALASKPTPMIRKTRLRPRRSAQTAGPPTTQPARQESATSVPAAEPCSDDRLDIEDQDRVLLVIEDDHRFTSILGDIAHEYGFKMLCTSRGEEGLKLARKYSPAAIMLDIELPGMVGWAVLDQLKRSPQTRHIPVHIVSIHDESHLSVRRGAYAFLQKPATRASLQAAFERIRAFLDRDVKRLLIVEDNDEQRQSMLHLIGNGDVKSTGVRGGGEALQRLEEEMFDCVVVDLRLPDMEGLELIKRIRAQAAFRDLPIVVYTGKPLESDERQRLESLAESVIFKEASGPQRLLDETSLFLHRVEAALPEPQRRILREIRDSDDALNGARVLLIDDDMRNIFAITSLLERHKMEVAYAENGEQGVQMLEQDPDFDVILMDMMMPVMDGYEATRLIRGREEFRSLPIIALTAKAMPEDRELCIDAGASDYISKPADPQQLLSLLRVWLSR